VQKLLEQEEKKKRDSDQGIKEKEQFRERLFSKIPENGKEKKRVKNEEKP